MIRRKGIRWDYNDTWLPAYHLARYEKQIKVAAILAEAKARIEEVMKG